MKNEYIDQYGIDSLKHLKEASLVGAEYFMTINMGMIADRAELEERFNIKIRTPEEMMQE